MGKVRKRQQSNHHDNPQRTRKIISRRHHSQDVSKNRKASQSPQVAKKPQPANTNLHAQIKVPFVLQDQVLLVGEGDFSFALSLVKYHNVGSVVATCYDYKEALEQKYPLVAKAITKLSGHKSRPCVSDDASPQENNADLHSQDQGEIWHGFSSPLQSESIAGEEGEEEREEACQDESNGNTTIFYGVDATKLSTAHRKLLRPHSPFTKIVFNFPHVGGLSTDVNRQVRSNQQLLVNFFNAAKPLLATQSTPARPIAKPDHEESEEGVYEQYDDGDVEHPDTEYLKHGKILVTLFEGEPYTLWNIRDLARHCGLKVVESFKFPWVAYPGYEHARTIGDITHGKDRSEEGKRKGAWRGEERDARCYVLALKDDDDGRPAPGSRKRKHWENDDSD